MLLRNLVALSAVGSSDVELSGVYPFDTTLLGEKAIQATANSWAIRRLTGTIYLQQTQSEWAIDVLGADQDYCPEALACFLQGQALYDTGRRDEAIAKWRSVIDLDVFFALKGDNAYSQGRVEEAVDTYLLSWELSPRIMPAKHMMLLNLCRNRRELGSFVEALQWCERARNARNDYWTTVELGRTYHEAGQFGLAETTLRQAIDILPEHSGAYQWLGLTLHQMDRAEEGIAALFESVRLNPTSIWPRLELANLLLQQKDFYSAACELVLSLDLTQDPATLQMIRATLDLIPIDADQLRNCKREN